MSVDEGHVNQAEFPEAAVQQAREEYSADSDSYGEKDPFKLKKEKKDADKKKKEKGYKTFEAAESFSEEDDERGKGKKRGSLFRSRFAPSAKAKPKDKQKGVDEKDGKAEERRPSKEKVKEEKKTKGSGEEKEKKTKGGVEDKKRSKSKEREKMKRKSHTIDVPYVKPEPVFGVPLAVAVERSKLYDNIELPRIVRECIDYVEEFGLTTAGIYRLSGVKSKVEALKTQYNANEKVNLKDHDPTIVTSLLKQYLREIPETILTTKLTPAFEHSAGLVNAEAKVSAFKKVLAQLPKCNLTLLSWMVVHLAHVLERKEETKMSIQNLSIVMCPTMRISHRTMNLLFTHWKDLFDEVKLKKCPKPLEWVPGATFEIPDTTAELEEELLRHETILAKMHEELNKGIAHKTTEDNLWEVQRVVTQLKRKLRVSRRVSETRLAAKEKELENKESSKTSSKERSPAKTMSLPPSAFKQDDKDKPEGVKEQPEAEVSEDKPRVPPSDEVDGAKEKTDAEKVVTEDAKEETREETQRKAESEAEDDKAAEPDLEMMKLLLLSQVEVVAEQEELVNIRNELHKRIEAERQEIARLQSAISEAKQAARRRGASVDSIDSSAASESSSESEDEEELQRILEGLIRENEELRRKNMQLSYNIHNEREACAELRVQIKLQEQMPQMLEALAQAGIKDAPLKQKAVPKDQSPRISTNAAIGQGQEAMKEQPLKMDDANGSREVVKNENTNSNNSPEVVKAEVGSDGPKDSERVRERHLEETAL